MDTISAVIFHRWSGCTPCAPDGNTLLIVSVSFVINPHLRKVNYGPLTSFEPVCYLVSGPLDRLNTTRYAQIKAAQESLTRFQPVMSHSFSDGSKRIAFHPRLLSDFNNIYELGLKIHEALDGEPERRVTKTLCTWAFRVAVAPQERLARLL
jgi:Tripartite tricarboxylate transporter family receptor